MRYAIYNEKGRARKTSSILEGNLVMNCPAPGGHLLDTPDRNVDKGNARVIIFGKRA
jgi:hypothetical protein